MNKLFLGTFILMATMVYGQASEPPATLTISTEYHAYVVGEKINLMVEVKNTSQDPIKLYSPEYPCVSELMVTNSKGVAMKLRELKVERKSFNHFMTIAPGASGVVSLWWGLAITDDAQLPADTYQIYLKVTNPPLNGCGENGKSYEKTDLSGTLTSNIITLHVVDQIKLGVKDLTFFSKFEEKDGVVKLEFSDRPPRMFMSITEEYQKNQPYTGGRLPNYREVIELKIGQTLHFVDHHSSCTIELIDKGGNYFLKVYYDSSFRGKSWQQTDLIPVPKAGH